MKPQKSILRECTTVIALNIAINLKICPVNWLKKGVFIGVLSVLFLVLLEVALRLTGAYKTTTEKAEGKYVSFYGRELPSWYYQREPYAGNDVTELHLNAKELKKRGMEFYYPIFSNSWGFRGADFDTIADKDKKRFLVLGDSFVEGVGTPADSTWTKLLQNFLQKGEVNTSVYNCGISGSDPFYEYVLLRDKLLLLKPQTVIMSVNYSDLNDVITRGGFERFKPDGTTQYKAAPWFEPYYKRFFIVRLWLHLVLRYDFSLLPPEKLEVETQSALISIADCILKTDSLCQANDITFLLVLHPYLNPLDPFIARQNEIQKIEALLPESIRTINLFAPMLNKTDKSNYKQFAYPIDMHFKPKGYQWFAQLVADEIMEKYPELLQP